MWYLSRVIAESITSTDLLSQGFTPCRKVDISRKKKKRRRRRRKGGKSGVSRDCVKKSALYVARRKTGTSICEARPPNTASARCGSIFRLENFGSQERKRERVKA